MSHIPTLLESAKALQEKTCSAVELTQSCLKTIEQKDPSIHAFLEVKAEEALLSARHIDEQRAMGNVLHPLAGIPVALKDNMLVKGWNITAGSAILKPHIATYDGTAVTRLKDAGMVLVGRTNMDEFAMGSSTESSAYGKTFNPHDTSCVPGGSSGGSAAAVAAHMVPGSFGSDTGGSIRQPAALCGVVGLKPTYGRVSRSGLIAMASSLDQIGPFATTVADAAALFEVVAGADVKDATTAEDQDTTIAQLLSKDVKGVRIGLPKEYFLDGMDTDVKASVLAVAKKLEDAGAIISEVSLSHAKDALAVYYVIMPCEVSSNLGRFDGMRYGLNTQGRTLIETYGNSRADGFGPEVKRRIMLGTFALSSGYYDAYYKKALQVRTLIRRDFDEVFKTVDVLLTPTSPTTAWKMGEKSKDPLTMYLADIYTISANLAGIPALSVPCGKVNNLPVGVQFMGRMFEESLLFRVGHTYEQL